MTEQGGDTDLVEQVARAIGAAHDELWPVRRRHQPRLRPEVMHGRAAAAALAVVRQAIEGMEPPELPIDGVGWGAHRLAVLRILGLGNHQVVTSDAVDDNVVHHSYSRSAEVYDLLYTGGGAKDYEAEGHRLDEIIHGINPNARTLLDVGCGTGLHMQQLVELGYTVDGVDISPAMVSVARARLPGTAITVADMRTLRLGRRFDAVTCLFAAIGYLLDPADLRKAFAAMAAHLNPGGVLIVDGWVRPESWRPRGIPPVEVVENDQMRVVRIGRSWRDGDITRLDMHHMVASRVGVEYFVEHHDLALMATADYVAAARAAGLEVSVERDYLPDRDRIIGMRPTG